MGVGLTKVGAVVVGVSNAPHEEDAVKGRRPVTLLLIISPKRKTESMRGSHTCSKLLESTCTEVVSEPPHVFGGSFAP